MSSVSRHLLALPPGYVLESYRIERVLGEGGFGITYLAQDTESEKLVAIKELLPGDIATRIAGSKVMPKGDHMREAFDWALDSFAKEAKALARLSHPNIVPIHRLFRANGTAYMVMDFVEGQSLKQWFAHHPQPTEDELRTILLPLLDGLEYVHARGLLHRDIKPDNIFLTCEGRPVLLDFGSARVDTGHTQTMTAVVSEGYSPFEQYQSKARQGPATDLYSLAAVMVRGITGATPPTAIDRTVEPGKPVAETHTGARYSKEFLEAVDAAFSVTVAQRPQGVADWRAMLQATGGQPEHLTQGSPLVRMETPRPRNRQSATPHAPAAANASSPDVAKKSAEVEADLGGPISVCSSSPPPSPGARAFPPSVENSLGASAASKRSAPQVDTPAEAPPSPHEGPPIDSKVRVKTVTVRIAPQNKVLWPPRRIVMVSALFALVGLITAMVLWPVTPSQTFRDTAGYYVQRVAFSADGTRIVTPVLGRTAARIGDVSSLKKRNNWIGEKIRHERWLGRHGRGLSDSLSVAFSPDGERVLTGGLDYARFWDAHTAQPVGDPMVHKGDVMHVEFDPKGKMCVTTSISPARTLIVTVYSSSSELLWSATAGSAESYLMGGAIFSPDGATIAIAGRDYVVRMWEAATGKPVVGRIQQATDVFGINFSPDGTKVVTRHRGGLARLWKTVTGEVLGDLEWQIWHSELSFSPDSTKIVAPDGDGTARLWDASNGKPLGVKMGSNVEYACFSPDGTKILTVSYNKIAMLWDASNGRQVGRPMRHDEHVEFACFSPDGTKIATQAGRDVLIWEVASVIPH